MSVESSEKKWSEKIQRIAEKREDGRTTTLSLGANEVPGVGKVGAGGVGGGVRLADSNGWEQVSAG